MIIKSKSMSHYPDLAPGADLRITTTQIRSITAVRDPFLSSMHPAFSQPSITWTSRARNSITHNFLPFHRLNPATQTLAWSLTSIKPTTTVSWNGSVHTYGDTRLDLLIRKSVWRSEWSPPGGMQYSHYAQQWNGTATRDEHEEPTTPT